MKRIALTLMALFTLVTMSLCSQIRDNADWVILRDSNGMSKHLDAFGRDKVAHPVQMLGAKFTYDLLSTQFSTSVTGSAVVTHDAIALNAVLRAGETTGDIAILQSNKYFPYQPAMAGEVMLSLSPGAVNTDVTKRFGYFDDNDGLYFKHDTLLSVCQRSKTSGTVVDNCVNQYQFNGLVVTSRSERDELLRNFDPSKSRVYFIAFQWLGTGVTHFYASGSTGEQVLLHTFRNPGLYEGAYMRRGSLPVRFEISSGSGTVTTSEMNVVCASVVSNGTEEDTLEEFAVGLATPSVTASTAETHLLSLRLAETFGNSDNYTIMLPSSFSFAAIAGRATFRVYLNSVLSGGTWVDVDSNSATEWSTDATITSNGRLIAQKSIFGDTTGAGGSTSYTASQETVGVRQLSLSRKNFNADSDYLTITVQQSGADAVTVDAAVIFGEIR